MSTVTRKVTTALATIIVAIATLVAPTTASAITGGTDAKAFARLGIRCFGFAPLKLPTDLDFAALFHGIDERVPVESVLFGTDVLEHFLLHS